MVKIPGVDRVVAIDPSTVRVWGMAGSGFSVSLIGQGTADWAVEFREAEKTLTLGRRFHLDRARRVVAFHCEPSEVEGALGELGDLLRVVNLGARRTTNRGAARSSRPTGRVTDIREGSRATRPKKRIAE